MLGSNEHESGEIEILDDSEIDTYLQDVMNVEKEIECMKCDRWPNDTKKEIEELEHLEMIGNNPNRKISNELYKLEIINADISIKI